MIRLTRSPLAWPYGPLALVVAIAFWPAWVEDSRLVIGGDTLLAHYPWWVLWRDLLAAGELPFWNPYTFSGLPALPTLQSGFGYPLHWLVTPLPPVRALNLMVGLHVIIAALGAAWCSGRLGASRSGQVLAGASYALGSALTARLVAGHISFVEANAWLPIATGLALDVDRRRGVVWLALAVGMLALAGQPELLIFSLWWLPLWAFAGARQAGPRRIWRALIRVVIALAIGGALAAFQLLPVVELVAISNRQGNMTWEFRTGASLPPWHLLTTIAPLLFGDPKGSYWVGPGYEWHERLLYVGIVPLFAAGLLRSRWRWLLWGAAGLAVLLAFGHYVPGYALTQLVPGYATFRIPSKHLVLAALALALAASLGFERLHGRRVALVAGVGALLVVLVALTAGVTVPWVAHALGAPSRLAEPGVVETALAVSASSLGWAALVLAGVAMLARAPARWARPGLLALTLLELGLVLHPYRTELIAPETQLQHRAALAGYERAVVVGPASALTANQGPVLKVAQPAGYMPIISGGYMQLATGGLNAGVAVEIPRIDDPAIGIFGYPVVLDLAESRLIVFEPPPPRVWVARCLRPGGALEARQPDFPRTMCVTRPGASAQSVPVPPGPATILDEGPGRLLVQAEGPGWLVTTQPWYPGWRAQVDGAPATVEILDGALVGTQLASGSHLVSLWYRPAGLDFGLGLTAAAALILLAAWWADRAPAPPSPSTSQPEPGRDMPPDHADDAVNRPLSRGAQSPDNRATAPSAGILAGPEADANAPRHAGHP